MALSKQTTHSKFLRTLIDPAGSISSIPDDKLRPHVLRQETATTNILICTPNPGETCGPGGAGLFILFPNYNGARMGAHYRLTPSGLKFDRWIKGARPLASDYRMARKISQVINISSTTASVGMVALGGTINAVKTHAYLSEIGLVSSFSYEDILSISADGREKISGLSVNEGLTVLSLPEGFDHDYELLEGGFGTCDGQPNTAFHGAGSVTHLSTGSWDWVSSTEGREQVYAGPCVVADILSSTVVTLSGGFIELQFDDPINTVRHIDCDLVGLKGALVARRTVEVSNSPGATEARPGQFFNGITFTFTEDDVSQPVVLVRLYVRFDYDGGKDPTSATFQDTSVAVTTARMGEPGNAMPIVLAAYSGLSNGQTLTVSGRANFEAIPKAALLGNITLEYGHYDPGDLTFAKLVLSHADRLGIRSLLTTTEHQELVKKLIFLSSYHQLKGESFDWSSILNIIRRIAVPVLAAVAPEFVPIASAVNGFIDSVGMAANSQSAPRRLGLSCDDPSIDGKLVRQIAANRWNNSMLVDTTGARIAMFPVILTQDDLPVGNTALPYVALELTPRVKNQVFHLLRRMQSYQFGRTRIYGAVSEDLPGPGVPQWSEDIILLPMVALTNDRLETSTDPVPVYGRSHQLACCVVSQPGNPYQRKGLPYPALFTGSVSSGTVQRVYGSAYKISLARSLGIPLIGNIDGADVETPTLSPMVASMGHPPMRGGKRHPRMLVSHMWGTDMKALSSSAIRASTDLQPDLEVPLIDLGWDDPIPDEVAAALEPVGEMLLPPSVEEATNRPLSVVTTMPTLEVDVPRLRSTANALFTGEGQPPPTREEKLATVMDFFNRQEDAFESLFLLLANGKEGSVRNTLNAAWENLKSSPPTKPRGDPIANLIHSSGAQIDRRVLEQAPRSEWAKIVKEAPKKKVTKRSKIQSSLERIVESNAHLRDHEQQFIDFFMAKGYVPSGTQIKLWLTTGEDPGDAWAETTINRRSPAEAFIESMVQKAQDPLEENRIREVARSMLDGDKGPDNELAKRIAIEINEVLASMRGQNKRYTPPARPRVQPSGPSRGGRVPPLAPVRETQQEGSPTPSTSRPPRSMAGGLLEVLERRGAGKKSLV